MSLVRISSISSALAKGATVPEAVRFGKDFIVKSVAAGACAGSRLDMLDSGLYAEVVLPKSYWSSTSTLGLVLPESPLLGPMQETFARTG